MKLKLVLVSALALAVSSTVAAPFFNPAALAMGPEATLLSLPVHHHKPCHGSANGPAGAGGLRSWLASALGRSRADAAAVATDLDRHHPSSWTIIQLTDDANTHVVVAPHAAGVHGRPGYASVEDARLHHDRERAHGGHHRQATALGRFNEALEELSFAEGLFVSFVLGAGLGSLAGILFKIVRLLAFRRQARKDRARKLCGSSPCGGRQSRKCRRAARVAARAAAQANAVEVDEKAFLKEELAQEVVLPAYRDVDQVSAPATSGTTA